MRLHVRVTIGAFTRPLTNVSLTLRVTIGVNVAAFLDTPFPHLLSGASGSVFEPNLVNLNDCKRWNGKGFRPYRFLRGVPYLRADVGRSTERHF